MTDNIMTTTQEPVVEENEATKLWEITQEPVVEENEATKLWEITQEPVVEENVTTTAPEKQINETVSFEAKPGAFDFINNFDAEQEIADAEAKAAADAKAEMEDIYASAISRMGRDKQTGKEISWETALNAEMDDRQANNPDVNCKKREEIIANIAEMVADKNEKIEANRTISDESAAIIAAAIEKGKLDREAYELSGLVKIAANLRQGKKQNGLEEEEIIDHAVELYLLSGRVKGYDEMSDEQKEIVHDALAARLAKFEEINNGMVKEPKGIKPVEQNEPAKKKSVLSTVVKFVKDHKEVIVAACGVAVAALSAVSILSPTGLFGIQTFAIGATTSAIFPPIFLGAAGIAAIYAGAKLVHKLVKKHSEKVVSQPVIEKAVEVSKDNVNVNEDRTVALIEDKKSVEQTNVTKPVVTRSNVTVKNGNKFVAGIRGFGRDVKNELQAQFARKNNQKVNG